MLLDVPVEILGALYKKKMIYDIQIGLLLWMLSPSISHLMPLDHFIAAFS